MKKVLTTALLTTMIAGAFLLAPGLSEALANSAATGSTSNAPQDLYIGITLEEAVQKAGFPVKLPSYLPEGMFLSTISYAGKLGQVSLSYIGLQKKPFFMELRKGSLQNEGLTFSEKAEIQVEKGKAYLGKKQAMSEQTVLAWEDQGVIYQLAGGYTAEELTKIANSVGVGTPPVGPEIISMESPNAITREQASEIIGFSVKVPTYLPQGMQLRIAHSPGMKTPMIDMYSTVSSDKIPFFMIMIRKGDLKQEAYGRVPEPERVQETTIGNAPAYVGKFPGTSFIDPTLIERVGLTFEGGPGEIYTIISDLPFEEIKKIAESMK